MLRADDAYAGSETFFRMRDKLEELFELCLKDCLENRPQALRQKASQLLEQKKGEER